MKIALGQIEVVPGKPNLNFAKMVEYIDQAKYYKADMIVFPELCIPGYLIGDMWEEKAFLMDCIQYGEDIKALSQCITIVFGNVAVDESRTHTDGRVRKYNALYCAQNGKFLNFHGLPYYIKTLLPNYREFDEPRHFTSSLEFKWIEGRGSYFTPVDINGVKVALTVCEDLWDSDYKVKPTQEYIDNGAELIINISGSPFTLGKNASRNRVFGEGHAKKNGIPLIYVNCVGMQNTGKNIFTFDGSSVAYDYQGYIVAQAPMFKEYLLYVDYKNGDIRGPRVVVPSSDMEEIERALLYGAEKFMESIGTKKVVIGISGGIDSAVAAVLYSRVVGPENLLLVNMPSCYNSETTIGIAEQIALNIGCNYASIPIGDSVELTMEQVNGVIVKDKSGSHKLLKLSDFHLENVQARDRGSRILAAVASAWGGVFTNNSNKTEITCGYSTLYGDLSGFLCTIGDLWKEQVYALGRHLNNKYDLLPEQVFTVKASAELSRDQDVDKGRGDPFVFWYHDRLFQSWMQRWIRCTPEDNLKWYMDKTIDKELGIPDGKSVYELFPTKQAFCEDLERWYKAFKGLAVAKRVQAPPIPVVSRRGFGFDYRECMGGFYLTRKYLEMKAKA